MSETHTDFLLRLARMGDATAALPEIPEHDAAHARADAATARAIASRIYFLERLSHWYETMLQKAGGDMASTWSNLKASRELAAWEEDPSKAPKVGERVEAVEVGWLETGEPAVYAVWRDDEQDWVEGRHDRERAIEEAFELRHAGIGAEVYACYNVGGTDDE